MYFLFVDRSKYVYVLLRLYDISYFDNLEASLNEN
jgi:hypothetical protein